MKVLSKQTWEKSSFKTVSRIALIAALSASASSVMAQDDNEEAELEEIVVSGFRSSIVNAIRAKRNADTVIEAISAEDIGRLPDISIAEALSRLPGITSQRVNGQSSAINIRGLSQSLTFSTLNGREQVTPNGNRSVEFEQFPSELISGADVYKSPKASLIEGGLAGTVALKTIRPLDRDEASFTINARGSFNDRANQISDANEFGYRISASYIDQFADGTIGIALGYARLVQPDVSVRFVGFDYQDPRVDIDGDGTNDAISFGFELEEQGGEDVRDGLIATVQWKPTENFTWEVDGYYSKFDSEGFGRGFRVIGPQEIVSGNTLVNNPIVQDNVLIGGQLVRNVGAPTVDGGGFGLTVQGINDNQQDEDELFTIGSKVEYLAGPWTFTGDFTYSKATSAFANEVSAVLPISSTNGGANGDAVLDTDLVIDFQLNGTELPFVNINQDFTDLDSVQFARFGVFPFENDDELFAFAGDVAYEVGGDFFRSFEFGARYSQRDATQSRVSADFGNDAGFFQFASNGFQPVALSSANSSVECFSGRFADAGFPCFLAVDVDSVVADAIGTVTPDQTQDFTRADSFLIQEDVFSAYALANIDTDFSGLRVTGNVGLRVVRTDQSSTNSLSGETLGIKYTEYLPSANFVFHVTENDQIRIGASRAISRPPLSQLGSGVNVSVTGNTLSGGGSGNPGLRPFLANQIDLSYEHYFGEDAAFVVAAFYKDLESFIASETDTAFDFEAAGLLSLVENEPTFPQVTSFIGSFGGPVNGEGGYIWGIEAAFSSSFDAFLPDALRGFGITANYSYTESAIDFTASNSGTELTLPLPGLSKHVFNPTLYYERAGFSNRVGIRYRSNFVSPQVGLNQQLPFTNSELVVDYQASYDFPEDSNFAGLTLLFQANNLTDEPVRTFFGNEAQTGTLQYFGRQFFFGASYSF